MERKELYSIGKVSKICDVSQRMLRYYEEIGLITPDEINSASRYRYYSAETMRRIQVIRYLIDQGFRLEEIKEIFTRDDLSQLQQAFLGKIAETRAEIEYYYQRLDSLKAWCALLIEGRGVHTHQNRSITLKYIPDDRFFYYEGTQEPNQQDADAYLEIEYFTRSKQEGHTMVDMGGSFYVSYDSLTARMENRCRSVRLLQTMYPKSKSESGICNFGGFLAVSCYHIGRRNTIGATYARMLQWVEEHEIALRGDCCERYVLDIYSTQNEENFVTEILLPMEDDAADYALLEEWKREN